MAACTFLGLLEQLNSRVKSAEQQIADQQSDFTILVQRQKTELKELAEEKSLDHITELARMKAEMEQMRLEKEQMRLEKERFETEAKHYEMEAKRKEQELAAALRMEQERELAIKEKKELDAMFSLFRDARFMYSNNESNVEYAFKNLDEKECKFLRSLEESGETILLVSTVVNQRRCSYSQNRSYENTPLICNVLTNCHFYDFTYTSFIKKNSTSTCVCPNIDLRENCNSLKTGIFYASKIYSFTNPLNLVHAKILLSLVSIPKIKGGKTIEDVERRPLSLFEAGNINPSIIRLIPGSYKNGSWRQQDGIYFNETTMEVSTIPPPDE